MHLPASPVNSARNARISSRPHRASTLHRYKHCSSSRPPPPSLTVHNTRRQDCPLGHSLLPQCLLALPSHTHLSAHPIHIVHLSNASTTHQHFFFTSYDAITLIRLLRRSQYAHIRQSSQSLDTPPPATLQIFTGSVNWYAGWLQGIKHRR